MFILEEIMLIAKRFLSFKLNNEDGINMIIYLIMSVIVIKNKECLRVETLYF